jgi:hypothetical protein
MCGLVDVLVDWMFTAHHDTTGAAGLRRKIEKRKNSGA